MPPSELDTALDPVSQEETFYVDLLESANGDEPDIDSTANNVAASSLFNLAGHQATGGHQRTLAGSLASAGWNSVNADTLENQLKDNRPL